MDNKKFDEVNNDILKFLSAAEYAVYGSGALDVRYSDLDRKDNIVKVALAMVTLYCNKTTKPEFEKKLRENYQRIIEDLKL